MDVGPSKEASGSSPPTMDEPNIDESSSSSTKRGEQSVSVTPRFRSRTSSANSVRFDLSSIQDDPNLKWYMGGAALVLGMGLLSGGLWRLVWFVVQLGTVIGIAVFLSQNNTFRDIVDAVFENSPSPLERLQQSIADKARDLDDLTDSDGEGNGGNKKRKGSVDPKRMSDFGGGGVGFMPLDIPDQLMEPIDRVLKLVIRDFVEWWYLASISLGDRRFPLHARSAFNVFVNNFVETLGRKDSVEMAIYLISSLSTNLIMDMRKVDEIMNLDEAARAERSKSEGENLLKKLRSTCEELLLTFAPRRDISSPLVESLLTEILTLQAWKTVQTLDEDWWNRFIIRVLKPAADDESGAPAGVGKVGLGNANGLGGVSEGAREMPNAEEAEVRSSVEGPAHLSNTLPSLPSSDGPISPSSRQIDPPPEANRPPEANPSPEVNRPIESQPGALHSDIISSYSSHVDPAVPIKSGMSKSESLASIQSFNSATAAESANARSKDISIRDLYELLLPVALRPGTARSEELTRQQRDAIVQYLEKTTPLPMPGSGRGDSDRPTLRGPGSQRLYAILHGGNDPMSDDFQMFMESRVPRGETLFQIFTMLDSFRRAVENLASEEEVLKQYAYSVLGKSIDKVELYLGEEGLGEGEAAIAVKQVLIDMEKTPSKDVFRQLENWVFREIEVEFFADFIARQRPRSPNPNPATTPIRFAASTLPNIPRMSSPDNRASPSSISSPSPSGLSLPSQIHSNDRISRSPSPSTPSGTRSLRSSGGPSSTDLDLGESMHEYSPPPSPSRQYLAAETPQLRRKSSTSSIQSVKPSSSEKVSVTDVSPPNAYDERQRVKKKAALEFVIAVESQGNPGFILHRTYAEMEKLDAQLLRLLPQAGTLSFPRALLPSTQFKESEAVCRGLESYLENLVSDPRYAQSAPVQAFFKKDRAAARQSMKIWELGRGVNEQLAKGGGLATKGLTTGLSTLTQAASTISRPLRRNTPDASSGGETTSSSRSRQSRGSLDVPGKEDGASREPTNGPALATWPEASASYSPQHESTLVDSLSDMAPNDSSLLNVVTSAAKLPFEVVQDAAGEVASLVTGDGANERRHPEYERSHQLTSERPYPEDAGGYVVEPPDTRKRPVDSGALTSQDLLRSPVGPPNPSFTQSTTNVSSSTPLQSAPLTTAVYYDHPKPETAGPQRRSVRNANPVAPLVSQQDFENILSAGLALLEEAYDLSARNWTFKRGILRMIEQVLRSSYAGTIKIYIQRMILTASDLEGIASWIDGFRDSFWPEGVWWVADPDTPKRTAEEKEETRKEARKLFIAQAPDGLKIALGAAATADAFGRLHDVLQQDARRLTGCLLIDAMRLLIL